MFLSKYIIPGYYIVKNIKANNIKIPRQHFDCNAGRMYIKRYYKFGQVFCCFVFRDYFYKIKQRLEWTDRTCPFKPLSLDAIEQRAVTVLIYLNYRCSFRSFCEPELYWLSVAVFEATAEELLLSERSLNISSEDELDWLTV